MPLAFGRWKKGYLKTAAIGFQVAFYGMDDGFAFIEKMLFIGKQNGKAALLWSKLKVGCKRCGSEAQTTWIAKWHKLLGRFFR